MTGNACQYVTEIQHMMFGYGDYKAPLLESARLIEGIVLQQMQSLLVQVSEFAEMRGKTDKIGHEDILFLLRKDRVELRRLLKYMEVKDLKARIYTAVDKEEIPIDEINPELELEVKPNKRPKTKLDCCIEFLKFIDQTGELYLVLDDKDIFDEEKHSRLLRQDAMSLNLDGLEYAMYEKARRSSFAAKSTSKFESWIYRDSGVTFKPTKLALEMIIYLAQETVAKIIDLCLIVKEKRIKAILAAKLRHQGNSTLSQPSHSNADFTFKCMTCNNISEEMNLKCITPNDLWEVLYSFYQPKYLQSAPSTCRVVDKRLFCC